MDALQIEATDFEACPIFPGAISGLRWRRWTDNQAIRENIFEFTGPMSDQGALDGRVSEAAYGRDYMQALVKYLVQKDLYTRCSPDPSEIRLLLGTAKVGWENIISACAPPALCAMSGDHNQT